MKLKKGDNVIVLSGNDKGKTGEVLEVIPKSEKVANLTLHCLPLTPGSYPARTRFAICTSV